VSICPDHLLDLLIEEKEGDPLKETEKKEVFGLFLKLTPVIPMCGVEDFLPEIRLRMSGLVYHDCLLWGRVVQYNSNSHDLSIPSYRGTLPSLSPHDKSKCVVPCRGVCVSRSVPACLTNRI
jgi:hypothetical protein